MKIYTYDYNGILVGEVKADLCQITELKKAEQSKRELKKGEAKIESVVIKPAYSTEIEPPKVKEGFEAVFNGEEWEVKEVPKNEEPEIKEEPELTYAEKRAAEYPSPFDYLDGIVKGDKAQIQKYIDDCLAVKAKYPKPKM